MDLHDSTTWFRNKSDPCNAILINPDLGLQITSNKDWLCRVMVPLCFRLLPRMQQDVWDSRWVCCVFSMKHNVKRGWQIPNVHLSVVHFSLEVVSLSKDTYVSHPKYNLKIQKNNQMLLEWEDCRPTVLLYCSIVLMVRDHFPTSPASHLLSQVTLWLTSLPH